MYIWWWGRWGRESANVHIPFNFKSATLVLGNPRLLPRLLPLGRVCEVQRNMGTQGQTRCTGVGTYCLTPKALTLLAYASPKERSTQALSYGAPHPVTIAPEILL